MGGRTGWFAALLASAAVVLAAPSAASGVPVGRVALAHFDVATDRWIAPAGTYTVMAGDSSRNLPSTKTLTLSQALVSPT